MSTRPTNATAAAPLDAGCATLMRRLGLTLDEVMSANRDAFLILRCHDEAGAPLVLKYAATASRHAWQRLMNEALLLKNLPVRAPMRLLPYRDHGPGYLLTEFDSGVLLRPGELDDEIVSDVADALVEFQAIDVNPAQLGVVDSDGPAARYLKVLAKHIVHLWPAWLSAAEAGRCLAIVLQSMPAILRRRVVCHGDFLPTNLLYHAEDRTVTITDLERFASADHPLFDVLSLCTTADTDIADWDWQPRFLARYLARSAAGPLDPRQLDPRSREFHDAYRGILVFFLAYRLSEARIDLLDARYFDGLAKGKYVTRKLRHLASGHQAVWREDDLAAALRVRSRNLRRVLAASGYREHVEMMGQCLVA